VDLSQQYYYPVYLIILFIWEILPTLVVTIFFRVQKPSSVMEVRQLSSLVIVSSLKAEY